MKKAAVILIALLGAISPAAFVYAETIELSMQSCGGLDANTMTIDQCLTSGSYVRGSSYTQAHTVFRFHSSSTIDTEEVTAAWIITKCGDQLAGQTDAKIYWGKRYISGETTWNQYTAGSNWGFAGGTSSTDRQQTDISLDTEIAFPVPCSANSVQIDLDAADIETNGSTTSVSVHIEPNAADTYFAFLPLNTFLYLEIGGSSPSATSTAAAELVWGTNYVTSTNPWEIIFDEVTISDATTSDIFAPYILTVMATSTETIPGCYIYTVAQTLDQVIGLMTSDYGAGTAWGFSVGEEHFDLDFRSFVTAMPEWVDDLREFFWTMFALAGWSGVGIWMWRDWIGGGDKSE